MADRFSGPFVLTPSSRTPRSMTCQMGVHPLGHPASEPVNGAVWRWPVLNQVNDDVLSSVERCSSFNQHGTRLD